MRPLDRFKITVTDTNPIPLAPKTLYARTWIQAQRKAARYLDNYAIIQIIEII